jgi:phage/conjugal plasmid C-4 type zinc finger TraR family protein
MKEYESIQGDNLEESEMGQLLATILNEDAVNRVRSRIPQGPSLSHCNECGDAIPEARQRVVAGCKLCIECQKFNERRA